MGPASGHHVAMVTGVSHVGRKRSQPGGGDVVGDSPTNDGYKGRGGPW